MAYSRISADCHIDLPWIPPDLFTANAAAALKDRMPFVKDGPDESGIGWVPYALDDLGLKMKPSDCWQRQCKATFKERSGGREPALSAARS
jgi:hypothetical protein